MRWPSSVGAFSAVTLQVACTPFQNFMTVRLACANAGWAAKPIAATTAQTEVRIIPPRQVNGTRDDWRRSESWDVVAVSRAPYSADIATHYHWKGGAVGCAALTFTSAATAGN